MLADSSTDNSSLGPKRRLRGTGQQTNRDLLAQNLELRVRVREGLWANRTCANSPCVPCQRSAFLRPVNRHEQHLPTLLNQAASKQRVSASLRYRLHIFSHPSEAQ